jgi:hypothetical protein
VVASQPGQQQHREPDAALERQRGTVAGGFAEDKRNRPAEFDAEELLPASALVEKLDATLEAASKVLARLTAADLLAEYDIQGYHVAGLYAVYQVVEHFGLHYGQILYITKNLCGKDLGFSSESRKTGQPAASEGKR